MKKLLVLIFVCMVSGCFLVDGPIKKQFEICLIPTVSNEPMKPPVNLQTEFKSVTRIVDQLAIKHNFTASSIETIAPCYLLKKYHRKSIAEDSQEIMISGDGKNNLICIYVDDNSGPN